MEIGLRPGRIYQTLKRRSSAGIFLDNFFFFSVVALWRATRRVPARGFTMFEAVHLAFGRALCQATYAIRIDEQNNLSFGLGNLFSTGLQRSCHILTANSLRENFAPATIEGHIHLHKALVFQHVRHSRRKTIRCANPSRDLGFAHARFHNRSAPGFIFCAPRKICMNAVESFVRGRYGSSFCFSLASSVRCLGAYFSSASGNVALPDFGEVPIVAAAHTRQRLQNGLVGEAPDSSEAVPGNRSSEPAIAKTMLVRHVIL